MVNNWDSLLEQLNAAKAVKKWEAQSKIKTRVRRFEADKIQFLQFKIPREDDSDIYKQNSPSALRKLAEQPRGSELNDEDLNMFEFVGSDLDRTMSVEDIIGAPTKPSIPREVREEVMSSIERLPSWLQSMILSKYSAIQEQYKENTVGFIQAIANRIDRRYRSRLRTGGNEDVFVIRGEGDRDYRDNNRLNYYALTNDAGIDDEEADDEEADEEGATSSIIQEKETIRRRPPSIQKTKTFTHFHDQNWKKLHPTSKDWRARHVSRANLKLRAALQTRAAFADLQAVAEDEELSKVNKKMVESDDDDTKDYQTSWDDIFDSEQTMKHAELSVDKDLTSLKKLTPAEKKERRLDKQLTKVGKRRFSSSWNNNNNGQNTDETIEKNSSHQLFVSRKEKRRKKRILMSRGYFRDINRLFNHNCGSFQKSPKRLEHTDRADDSFHNYCVALVSWFWFKCLIIVIIILNAIMLLIETSGVKVITAHGFYFEVFDHIFVAIYLMEFVIKVYAHPFGYWRSGFNLFDFVILVSSLVKTIMDWTDAADLNLVRVLLIIRALRVLRGISLSVQLQVLVSALVNTIKTHALSVVILLIILLYLVSIIAFFLFGNLLPKYFGTVGQGMLTLIGFLTIDGWTNVHEELAGVAGVGGTVFSVICIILGNFLFSNIFVAIIITNISEATDDYRDKQREQRETVIRMKKEKVFHRQKLDLHQLFARQRTSAFTDFFSLGQQFQKLLRHDDLVAMTDAVNSPLWIDSVYQSQLRSTHTSNVLMNLHREMADNLMDQYRRFGENQLTYTPIRRGRYNRCLNLKAKLALIKQEIVNTRRAKGEGSKRPRIKLP